jgi:peroxiredoxin
VTIAVGEAAPDFELSDQHGTPVRLSSFFERDAARRARAVLLVFFPWAFSSVCTGEFAALRDDPADFDNDRVALLGISVDSMYALRAFAEHEQVSFPLLADFWPHGAVAQRYGVLDETLGAARRATFLIDSGGIVRWTKVVDLGTARDRGEYLAALDRLTGAGA